VHPAAKILATPMRGSSSVGLVSYLNISPSVSQSFNLWVSHAAA